MQAYVINLDKASERMMRMTALLDAMAIPFERIAAVHGDALSPDFIEAISRPVAELPTPNVGQIGCFLSHKIAWERVSKGADPFGLILEDDVVFARNFGAIIHDSRIVVGAPDIVRLEGWPEKVWMRRSEIKLSEGYTRRQLTGRTFGTCGYLISRECAGRLVRTVNHYRAPIDHMLFWQDSAMGIPLNVMMLVPAACYQHLFYFGSAGGYAHYLDTSIAATPLLKSRASSIEKVAKEISRFAKRVTNISKGMVRSSIPLHPIGPFELPEHGI